MPKIIFLNNLYYKHNAYDLKNILERKLYGKVVDICEYNLKRKVSIDDPYGEENWDETSIKYLESINPIYENIRIDGVLYSTRTSTLVARTIKGIVSLGYNKLIVYDKENKIKESYVKLYEEFNTVDPYGEEVWGEENITCVHCKKKDGKYRINPIESDRMDQNVWEYICFDCYSRLMSIYWTQFSQI